MERADPASAPTPQQPRSNLRSSRSGWPVVLLLLAAGAGAGFWYVNRQQAAPTALPEPTPAVVIPNVPVPEAAMAPAMPPVAEADGRVRQALRALSALAPWLQTEDLARRFVAAVNAVADDESPRPSLSFLSVEGGFSVVERDGRVFVDPRGYARYDALAGVVGSLDTRGAAGAYRELKPLLEGAYREIGRPGTTFEQTLSRAVGKLLAVPVPQGEVELVPVKLVYGYSDPALEALSPAQKQLLRTGPANARRVQEKLRELSREIGLPQPAAETRTGSALPER
jgi:hypothetical protein